MIDATVELKDDFYQDPHSVYSTLREQGPVHHMRLPDGTLGWLILDYDLAKQVLLDTSAVSKDLQTPMCRTAVTRGHAGHAELPMLYGSMLWTDPPQHTRLRTLVGKALHGSAIRRLAPRAAEVADGLLDELRTLESADLIANYAFPLPGIMICELLGVPDEDKNDFRSWSTVLLADESTPMELGRASAEFTAYLTNLIAQLAAEPGPGLLSDLIAARDNDDRLSVRELIGTVVLLMVGGYETTMGLIGNAILELLTDQDLLARMRDEPDRIPAFLEEVVRWQGPFHFGTLRYTTTSMLLGGHDIGPGELIFVSLAGANRDPHHFDAPESFQADRQPNHHIGFGVGVHYCVGAQLARMESAIAIERLLSRYPNLTLLSNADDLAWRKAPILNTLVELPVRLQPSAMAP
jgi:cytochrome P450